MYIILILVILLFNLVVPTTCIYNIRILFAMQVLQNLQYNVKPSSQRYNKIKTKQPVMGELDLCLLFNYA